MPVFAYKGVTATGRSTKGWLDADSARVARTKLRHDGILSLSNGLQFLIVQ